MQQMWSFFFKEICNLHFYFHILDIAANTTRISMLWGQENYSWYLGGHLLSIKNIQFDPQLGFVVHVTLSVCCWWRLCTKSATFYIDLLRTMSVLIQHHSISILSIEQIYFYMLVVLKFLLKNKSFALKEINYVIHLRHC